MTSSTLASFKQTRSRRRRQNEMISSRRGQTRPADRRTDASQAGRQSRGASPGPPRQRPDRRSALQALPSLLPSTVYLFATFLTEDAPPPPTHRPRTTTANYSTRLQQQQRQRCWSVGIVQSCSQLQWAFIHLTQRQHSPTLGAKPSTKLITLQLHATFFCNAISSMMGRQDTGTHGHLITNHSCTSWTTLLTELFRCQNQVAPGWINLKLTKEWNIQSSKFQIH